MKYVSVCFLVILFLVGCEDRYRYFCQDPKNFQAKRCQKPDCQFTQDCPEYLVAPILEKKVESTQPTQNPVPNN